MSDSVVAAKLRLALADQVGSPGWRQALEAVPRELFLGEAVYRYEPGRGWVPVHRSEMSAEDWLALAYTDETWVTQLNGVLAEDATEPVLISRPTSSSTFPGLIVLMLEAAGISEGDTVLEIGTGTGYSSALMCHRLGDKAVTSIEYDPVLADRAETAITRAGYAPHLAVGDGLQGYDANAPYDRLIATCAVRTIPLMWLWQVRAGGTITTPMRGWTDGVAFAHLRVAEDGSASGFFLKDDVYFMTARPHLPPPQPSLVMGRGAVSEGRVDPLILKDDTALWVAQLAVPQAQHAWAEDILTLFDSGTGSQADVRPNSDGGWTVRQHGPIKLWDEAEEAVLTWMGADSPHQSGFGLTVTKDRQYVWLGEPDGPSWDLPA
ncbi:ATP-grasp peptide maturase system methyltransferase [Streptosporangium sp. NBC_01755]|uniref:ATP-grasp peptide maturase system methyltransferase n=1 Tax=Streptosporangium sp. NBC_01755 TaxID=2975949 RepID=UPI002DD7B72F|nr:ATP-grasp peptide maturase system methyltransferase [Streptosporangium sp. NBC_01755]WSD02709.1 ATP-grasp peptide maturase system methyltransferase [Streptosporangium sp. NBC_01755]